MKTETQLLLEYIQKLEARIYKLEQLTKNLRPQ